jgi:hypothetical protein
MAKQRVEIVLRHNVGEIECCFKGMSTPKELIGVKGYLLWIDDNAYNTSRPTGYERAFGYIIPDGGITEELKPFVDDEEKDCIVVDMGFVKYSR